MGVQTVELRDENEEGMLKKKKKKKNDSALCCLQVKNESISLTCTEDITFL